MPWAARRSPYGSRDPVGRSPAANMLTTVSSLSASDTAAHVTAALPSCSFVGRRRCLDAHGQIVEIDRLPDFLGPAILARVDAAHRALKFGELAHHVGRKIRLGELPRFPRERFGLWRLEHPSRDLRPPVRRRAPTSADTCRSSCETAPYRAASGATPAAAVDRFDRRTARHEAAPSARAPCCARRSRADPAPC